MNLKTYLEQNSNAEFARALSCPPAFISQWKSGHRPIPLEYMADIERVTNGQVTRQEMRPNDWESIWPELTEKAA